MVGDPRLRRLRGVVRQLRRRPLARVRPRHRVPQPRRERRRVLPRVVHDAPRADALALVALPPPLRHAHRRTRSRDPVHAAVPPAHRRAEPAVAGQRPEADLAHRPSRAGRVDDEARDFVPPDEIRRLVWEARAFVAVYVGVTVWCLATWSIVPALFLVLPSFYGVWLLWIFATTQHAGLREDVLDHRLNTRTVHMNPIARFLYLNMNYHLEHHLFPGVPYHALPALHDEVKDYLPPPKSSIAEAYREIVTALRHQHKDPAWELPLPVLPAIAAPALVSNEPIFAEKVGFEQTGSPRRPRPGRPARTGTAPRHRHRGAPVRPVPPERRDVRARRRAVHARQGAAGRRPAPRRVHRVPEAQRALRRLHRRGGAQAGQAAARHIPRQSRRAAASSPSVDRPRTLDSEFRRA